jgi:hypothetical protein
VVVLGAHLVDQMGWLLVETGFVHLVDFEVVPERVLGPAVDFQSWDLGWVLPAQVVDS